MTVNECHIKEFRKEINKFVEERDIKATISNVKKFLVSEINAIRHNVSHLSNENAKTEIYLDRYLPCKILNMIRDMTEESITDYNGRKEFCERVKAQFDLFKDKIKREEHEDFMKRSAKEFINKL